MKKKFFPKNLFKVIAVLVVCSLAILVCAIVVFLTIIGFKATLPVVRILVALIVASIAVLTVRTILKKTHFYNLWSGLRDDIYDRKNRYEKDLYNKYNVLMTKYPISVSQFEAKYWRQNPLVTNYQVMEQALKIDEIEWDEMERKARQQMNKKECE